MATLMGGNSFPACKCLNPDTNQIHVFCSLIRWKRKSIAPFLPLESEYFITGACEKIVDDIIIYKWKR